MATANRIATGLPLTLKVTEVAHLLQIGRTAAYELVASGGIPSIRIGRSVRVPTQDLLRWIEAQKSSA